MDIYYAIGSGLGHVNRARLFIEKLGLQNIVVVINDERKSALLKGLPHRVLPIAASQRHNLAKCYIKDIIDFYRPQKVYLDTFPSGIVGEWCAVNDDKIQFYLVSRILKTDVYYQSLSSKSIPRFKKIFICEKVSNAQLIFLRKLSIDDEIVPVDLKHELRNSNVNRKTLRIDKKLWVIIHSGNIEECLVLYHYALDVVQLQKEKPKIIFLHPNSKLLKSVIKESVIEDFGLASYVKVADKIFTACGYNLMHELTNFKEKHIFIPFKRKFDDQFLRAKHFKRLI